jgi:hypothetical protein
MAAVSGTYTSATAVGQREDLTDLITNISYTSTPFISSIGTTDASAILHEWQTDELRAPAGNAANEGNDASFTAPTPTARPSNSCQILEETLIVSGTLEKVKKAGRKSEVNYQLAKKLKELARDLELAAIHETENTGDPRRMDGLATWIATNEVAAATAALDETHFDSAMELCWIESGETPEYRAVMSSFQKKAVTGFTGHAGTSLNIDLKEKKLINTVTVYESDFGMVYCIPHQMMANHAAGVGLRGGAAVNAADEVYIYRPDLFKLAKLRPTQTTPLAKTGDATKYMINMELTLESRQEKGSAKITGLATS